MAPSQSVPWADNRADAADQHMEIVKLNGQRVKYDRGHIRETLLRVKAKPELVDHIMRNVERQMYDGMTTGELFALVHRELHKENRCLAHRYNLRAGLLKLGPAGFNFEKYVASILQAYQYDARLPEKELPGLCVNHEVDVIANKGHHCIMIEAKFRNRFDDTVTLKDVMATWARYLDLREGLKNEDTCPRFNELWIVTNGRFSDRARQFGVCKGLHLIGWSATEWSLAQMVDHAALYPITVIDGLRQWELDRFAKAGLMLCREVADKSPEAVARILGVPPERAAKIRDDAKEVVSL